MKEKDHEYTHSRARGIGNIGAHVVGRLRAAGKGVRILSRHPRANEPGIEHVPGDTVEGTGLAAALEGVDTVLHLASGAESMPIGYFRAKAAAEEAIAGSGVPLTVLRAAQLHDFVLPVVRVLARMPLVPVPGGLCFEPVHVREVADHLTELALGEPAGRVADLVGPEVLDVQKLLEGYWEVFGHRHPLLPMRIPGAIGRAYRGGESLADSGARRGQLGWREFLAEQGAAARQGSVQAQHRSA